MVGKSPITRTRDTRRRTEKRGAHFKPFGAWCKVSGETKKVSRLKSRMKTKIQNTNPKFVWLGVILLAFVITPDLKL